MSVGDGAKGNAGSSEGSEGVSANVRDCEDCAKGDCPWHCPHPVDSVDRALWCERNGWGTTNKAFSVLAAEVRRLRDELADVSDENDTNEAHAAHLQDRLKLPRNKLAEEVTRLREVELRFKLDRGGIEAREREAVELVERRADVVRLREENARLQELDAIHEARYVQAEKERAEFLGGYRVFRDKLARVEALPKQWTDTGAAYRDEGASTAKADAFEDCADQLEAALNASESAAEADEP